MINFASLETISFDNYDLWTKDEKMAYCEASSALISERKSSIFSKIISNIFTIHNK